MAPRQHYRVSELQQFFAVLRKNFLLRTSGSRAGALAGWLGLALEILLPVAFFLIMCVPRHYIKPTPLPAQFFPQGTLDSLDWVMAYYKGPGAASDTGASVLFAPNTTKELELMTGVAKALSCQGSKPAVAPRDELAAAAAAQGDASVSNAVFIQHFSDLFPVEGRPALCANRSACLASPECYEPLLGRQLRGFATEREAVAHALANPKTVDGVLAFTGGVGSSRVSYDIRLNHTLVPDTRARLNKLQVRPGVQYRDYWFFVNLEQYVNRAIIGQQRTASASDTDDHAAAEARGVGGQGGSGAEFVPADVRFSVKPYPWPAKVINFAAFISGGFFKLLMVLAFLPQVKAAVVSVVQEKELRLWEGMKTLGLHDGAYWASWTITHFSTLFASGVGCAVVGTYAFPHTSFGVMLLFYALASLALVTFSYFLSTFFSTQRVAGFASVMIFCAAMLPGYLLPALVQPYGGLGWTLACLLPPSAITLFVECILGAETVERGVTWGTLRVSAAVEYRFSPSLVLSLLALDCVLFGLLTLYCDQVLPGEWGQKQPWWFPLSPAYWRSLYRNLFTAPSSFSSSSSGSGNADGQSDIQAPLLSAEGRETTPPAPDGVAVSIQGLNKVFHTSDGKQKHAVRDLSLDFFKGQITALLGHNGAGKTTTISILTGMLPASGGSAVVNGRRVDQDMAGIRGSLGLCPQFDILWPTITVRDHLRLYASIKGVPRAEVAAAALEAAEGVGLGDKLGSPAGELSGGEARKLSVAIAFMGRPEVVFLDEPTSTMDPYSRRFTWDVIRKCRKECAVILTTHSMEEADMLSDRIAIMAGGSLSAVGTSLELKARYGAGYTLSVLTNEAAAGASGPNGRASSEEAGDALERLVRHHVRGAALLSHVGAEMQLRLPAGGSSSFGAMLRDLDARSEELGVTSYGLGVTTLEEVFLKVTRDAEAKSLSRQHRHDGEASEEEGPASVEASPGSVLPVSSRPSPSHSRLSADSFSFSPPHQDPRNGASPPSASGRSSSGGVSRSGAGSRARLYCRQVRALVAKRALCFLRDWGASAAQLGVPLLLVLVALYARTSTVRIDELPPRSIGRAGAAFSLPPALGASAGARSADAAGLRAFAGAYPGPAPPIDTGTSALQSWFKPLPVNETLDGWLLGNWYTADNHTYDAVFVDALSAASGGGDPSLHEASLTLMINETALHGLPLAVGDACTALLRVASGDPSAEISVRSHPLPALPFEVSQQIEASAGNLLLVLLVVLAMAGISASFSVFLVREAASGAKLVQLVAGCPRSAFWVSNAAFDLSVMAALGAATLAGFFLSALPEFHGPGQIAALSAATALFSLSSVPLTYALQFLYADEMEALQGINTLLTSVGVLGFLVVWILELVYSFFSSPRVLLLLQATKGALRAVSPHYCFGQCIYSLADDYDAGSGAGKEGPWAAEVTGRYLVSMAIQAAVYSFITIAAEVFAGRRAELLSCLPRGWRSGRPDGPPRGDEESSDNAAPMDPDVAEEERRTRRAAQRGSPGPTCQLLLAGASKTFSHANGPLMGLLGGAPPTRAVRDVWLGVGRGECLGLLGVSGAGKTTAFRVAIGELAPSAGDVAVCGNSVTRRLAAARTCIGYCPQADPLLPLMTGTEMLRLFAALRGVPEASAPLMVDTMIRRLGLQEYSSRSCGSYSGGNKRKLSVCAALVGEPPVVLLDEPSAGLDPGARHFLWDYMTKEVLHADRSVLLTSHSMEECEVLCGRIAVMAAGGLRCIGTPQHLKARFAEGYSLELRLVDPPSPEAAKKFFEKLASVGKILESERGRALVRLPAAGLRLPEIFDDLEKHREAAGIADYSLSQTTLEQVFLRLASSSHGASPSS